MTETRWEDAKKSHKNNNKLIISFLLPLFFITAVIIINNNDVFSGKKNETVKETIPSDSLLLCSSIESEETYHSEQNENVEKDQGVLANTTNSKDKACKDDSTKKNNSGLNVDKEQGKKKEKKEFEMVSEEKMRTSDTLEHVKYNKKNNNISSQQYSILLPGVQSKVNDRKDIIISLALELFYNDTSETHEILIRRDVLKVIAQKVIQNKDFSMIKKELLSEELINEMNLIFDRKTLVKVNIREFQIEKATAQ